jgi:DNA adenine methylase
MRNASPLRYPGGKAALSDLLGSVRRLNGLGSRCVAEPFAGGAGASLSMLFLEETDEIRINDADPAIHDLWWALIHEPAAFAEKLSAAVLDMTEWHKQRRIYRAPESSSRLDRGFAAFYLNRCNRSGIIMNGGPIGGIDQAGKWKIDARFNKPELLARCLKVSEYASRIHATGIDGIDFIRRADNDRTFFFVDPPYFGKGRTLYLNAADGDYHLHLADVLRSMTDAPWVLTYDDCPSIRSMYEGWATIRPFGLRYAAAERRSGREILVTPKWMRLPSEQASLSITW